MEQNERLLLFHSQPQIIIFYMLVSSQNLGYKQARGHLSSFIVYAAGSERSVVEKAENSRFGELSTFQIREPVLDSNVFSIRKNKNEPQNVNYLNYVEFDT